MQNVLIVVDMQNDFISGPLGSKDAEEIVPKIYSYIKNFKGKKYFTQDTHQRETYLESEEGKNLPILHCLESTHGAEIEKTLLPLVDSSPIKKGSFASVELGEILREENKNEKIENITLVGLCTDICVISNAILLKAFLPNAHIIVMKDLCSGTSVENHKRALEEMKILGIEISEDI